MQASDRFMRLMEKKGPTAPQHLIVFITSDEDFSEKIAELQSRNFKVEVLYHNPSASKKPVSIINAADQAYDWLPFLRGHLENPHLTLTYDPTQFHPAGHSSPVHQPSKPPGAAAPHQPIAAKVVQAPKAAPSRRPNKWAPLPSQPAVSALNSGQVEIFGLVDGEPSISKICSMLLAQHVSQRVVDSTTITVLMGKKHPFAVLDCSAATDPAKQAADIVKALDGQSWMQSKVKAQLSGAVAPASSNTVSQPSVRGPTAQQWAGSERPMVFDTNSKPFMPAIVSSSPMLGTSKIAFPPADAAEVKGSGSGSGAAAYEHRNSGLNGHSKAVADSVDPSKEHVAANGGAAMRSSSLAGSKRDVNVSGGGDGLYDDAALIGLYSKGSSKAGWAKDGVSWGFDNALDGKTLMFSPETSALMEQQYWQLQGVEEADQAASQHRYSIWYSQLPS